MVRDHFYKEVSKIMGWDFRSLHLISCSVHKFPVCIGTNCLNALFLNFPLEIGLTAFPYFVGNSVRVNIVRDLGVCLVKIALGRGSQRGSCRQLRACSYCLYQVGQHLKSCIFHTAAVPVFRLSTELTVIWVDRVFFSQSIKLRHCPWMPVL